MEQIINPHLEGCDRLGYLPNYVTGCTCKALWERQPKPSKSGLCCLINIDFHCSFCNEKYCMDCVIDQSDFCKSQGSLKPSCRVCDRRGIWQMNIDAEARITATQQRRQHVP